MDGGDFGYPLCGGYAASNNGGDGSGGCRWGGAGGANYSAGSSNGYFATAAALEAPGRMQQQQPMHPNLHNQSINFYYQQQRTQQSAVGWTNGGGAPIPNLSFIPVQTNGGGPQLHQSHPLHSTSYYSNNNAVANNTFQCLLFAQSAHMATGQPSMHNYGQHGAVSAVAQTGTTPYSVPNSHAQYSHTSSSLPVQTPPSNNDQSEFFIKDELKGFFAAGQSQGLSPFCNGVDKHRKAMEREIKKHDILQRLYNQRKSRALTEDDSKMALEYIDGLSLPSRLQPTPSVTSTTASPEVASTSPIDPAQEVAAAVESLQSVVKALFSTHISFGDCGVLMGKDALLQDPSFVNAMKMLKGHGINEVPCGNGYTAKSCQSMSPPCDTLMLVRVQSNGQQCCGLCAKRARKAVVSNERNEANREKRVAHDSKTPLSKLTADELHDRSQNIRNEKKRLNSLASKLRDQVTRELNDPENVMRPIAPDERDESEPPSKEQQFIDYVKVMLNDLLGRDRKETKKCLKDLLNTVMSALVEKDKSEKNPIEVDDKDLDNVVDFLVAGMQNTSKALNGKEKQCQFSPTIFALCDGMYDTSPAAFRQAKALSPLHIFPSERTMKRRKAENKIADGMTSKPYELKKEEMKARNVKVLRGYLECDEMKLKDGVVFRTKTNEPVGLANDMLDLESLLRRVLSDEGDKLEAAQYVNQWQYVAITSDGVEYVLLEHFFNNGSLTAKTLNNQFRHVLFMCESVNMEVSGLCFDAGGNNSRLFADLHSLNGSEIVKQDAWLNDEDCYIAHPLDPTRRIYIWFCTTHVMKAMRNQYLSSQQGGAKAFLDKDGFDIGWHFIKKLYAEHCKREKVTNGKCTSGVRLTEKVVNPNKSDKMNVRVAKITFEDKTLAFGIEMICGELGISIDDVLSETEAARSKYIHRQSESKEKHFSDLRHGHFIEIALHLMKVYKERNNFPMDSDEEEAEEAPLDETDEAEEDEFDDSWEDEVDWDEVFYSLGIEQPSTQREPDEPDTLGKDIASLIYMAHVNALFHNLVMCKHEKISSSNVDLVEDLVKKLFSYFDRWKSAQLKRKAANDDEWERTFLAPQTWRNLRYSIFGFLHFSRYMTQYTDLDYVPVLCSNQSSLENAFSRQRRGGFDTAPTYSGGVSSATSRANIANSTGRCYQAEDCIVGSGNEMRVDANSSQSRKARDAADNALANLIAKRKAIIEGTNHVQTPFWMFQTEQPTTKRAKFKDLAKQLNMSLDSSAMDIVMGTKSFEFFVRLCHDKDDTSLWLDKLVSSDDAFLNELFTSIATNLLAFLEEELYRRSFSFESAIFGFISSDSFHTIYVEDLFAFDGVTNTLGTVAIVEAVVEYFAARVYKVISDKNVVPEDEKVEIDSPCFPRMLQNIVGSAIAKSRDKFCSSGTKSLENTLFSSLGIKRTDALINDEYKAKWYPPQSQIENQGMLTLIHPEFINWSCKVMLFTCNAFSNRRMIVHRGSVIQVGMKELLTDKEMYNTFVEAAQKSIDTSKLGPGRLRKIYIRLCERIFHSYTGKFWDDYFNESKKKSDHASNIQFRHQLQLRGSVTTSSSTTKKKKKRETQPLLANLLKIGESSRKRSSNGGENNGSKRRRTDEDFKVTYQQLYTSEVIPRLRRLRDLEPATIKSTNQLNKSHRLALLFVKFHIFHRDTSSINATTVKNLLETELRKDENKTWSDGLRNNNDNTTTQAAT